MIFSAKHPLKGLFVKGVVTKGAEIEGHLKKDGQINRVTVCKDGGDKDASYIKTVYQPLKNYRNMTMLEAKAGKFPVVLP